MQLTRPAALLAAALAAAACGTPTSKPQPSAPELEEVWEFPDRQLTGVGVSSEGRVFVNFPRWGGFHDLSVAEITSDGLIAYPDQAWNSWTLDDPERPGEA